MKFIEILKQQATYKLMHIRGEKEEEDQQNFSCQTCYLTKDIIKHERFDRF